MPLIRLLIAHKDVILYLVFGVITTIANIAAYYMASRLLHCGTLVSTVFAWIVAVTLAWLTNRVWVFHSSARGVAAIARELMAFYLCRIATGIADLIIMLLCVDLMHLNDVIIKTLANVVVIVLNYVASKWIIFKKK